MILLISLLLRAESNSSPIKRKIVHQNQRDHTVLSELHSQAYFIFAPLETPEGRWFRPSFEHTPIYIVFGGNMSIPRKRLYHMTTGWKMLHWANPLQSIITIFTDEWHTKSDLVQEGLQSGKYMFTRSPAT